MIFVWVFIKENDNAKILIFLMFFLLLFGYVFSVLMGSGYWIMHTYNNVNALFTNINTRYICRRRCCTFCTLITAHLVLVSIFHIFRIMIVPTFFPQLIAAFMCFLQLGCLLL